MGKQKQYASALKEIRAIFQSEGSPRLDDIAMMATINSVLAHTFEYLFWTGFYRICGRSLIVGPYIGTVGCLEIPIGRGVCGTAAAEKRTLIVPDVTKFPVTSPAIHALRDRGAGFRTAPELIAVLDVDSERPAAFDEEDRKGLERICELFGK